MTHRSIAALLADDYLCSNDWQSGYDLPADDAITAPKPLVSGEMEAGLRFFQHRVHARKSSRKSCVTLDKTA